MQSDPSQPVLSIIDFVTYIHLGCSTDERSRAQEVKFSIDIYLPKSPKAEQSDSLSDAVCYAKVCEELREFVEGQEFQLVESLGRQSLDFIRDQFNLQSLKLCIHKVAPPFDGIQGGVKYVCASGV